MLIYRVFFFTGPLPKKLKYGKPRLKIKKNKKMKKRGEDGCVMLIYKSGARPQVWDCGLPTSVISVTSVADQCYVNGAKI